MCSSLRRDTNAVNGASATSASLRSSPVSGSRTAFGYSIRVHAVSLIPAIARATVGHYGIVNENHAPCRSAAVTFSPEQNAESARVST